MSFRESIRFGSVLRTYLDASMMGFVLEMFRCNIFSPTHFDCLKINKW